MVNRNHFTLWDKIVFVLGRFGWVDTSPGPSSEDEMRTTCPDTNGAPRRDGFASPRESMVRAGLESWVRERMLPRLVPLTPDEIADRTRSGRLRVLTALLRALRGERRRGRSGHWSYSLDRHIGLVQAVAAERAEIIAAPQRRETANRPSSTAP